MLHGVSVFTVAAVLLLILLSVTGLLGVWVALGRGHWFVRMLGLAAWLGMWLLVPAYEITAILFFESLVVVPPLLLARHLRARAPGDPLVQFGLRDLLLFVVVVAAVSATGTAAPRSVWTSWWAGSPRILNLSPSLPPWAVFSAIGVVAGCFLLLVTWIALGRCRSRIRTWSLVVLILGMPLAMVLAWPAIPGAATMRAGMFDVGAGASLVVAVAASVSLVVPVVVLYGVLGIRTSASDSPSEARGGLGRVRRSAAAVLAGVVVAGLLMPSLGLFYVLMTSPPIPEETLPEPDGYLTLIHVACVLENVTVPRVDPLLPEEEHAGPDDFRAFREQHGALVSEAQAALDIPCRVPVVYDSWAFYEFAPDPVVFRHLAYALVAMGRCKHLDGDDVAAASYYLDTVRLGRHIGQGGLFFDGLVGVAVEGLGLYELHWAHNSLPMAVRHNLRRRLLDPREQREPLEAAQRREDIAVANSSGWWGRLFGVIERYNGETAATLEIGEAAEKRTDAQCQILLAELALADYRDEHGAYPKTLDALAPAYLDETPKDPFGTGPLVYRTTDKGYELYSVGPNGLDDGRKSVLNTIDSTGDDVWFWE